ncbi:Uncharacterized protein FKW44_004953 [Caligus rogercresseyi]|uniref:Uncharacterized protein n=1 Tax=Caligus rogercresseyi TaxID=217165 RepID=A0A7T8KAX2_CALRO|nr:Uncharacterized protein FKW44_004953 [Caligus rogercresseyi]
MSSEQDRCAAILVALQAVAQELNESNGNATPIRKTQDQPRSKKKGLQSFSRAPGEDQRRSWYLYEDLAAKMNVDEKTIRIAVHEDLRSKSYVLKVRQMLSEEIWPPSSQDCKPLDYYVWGVLERESNKRAHNSVVSLKAFIAVAVASMNRKHLVTPVRSSGPARGGHRG